MKIFDQTFEHINFDRQLLSREGYDNCIFKNCTFSTADFADVSFMECTFKICDFSLAKMDNASIKDVSFIGCNFIGVDLSVCSPFLFKARFEECQMDLIIATKMKLKGTHFTNCSLKEADFSECDLSYVLFDKCNLERAIFHRTNLEKTDFRTAVNYTLDPSNNTLKKTIFSPAGVKGLLSSFDIIIKN
ncbi:MAG: pentapeptide repeat-containing protein [Saprospiraceae bacterium]|nr:pentapeptide repeat-containing protein [Saprospiraceae bacterium]